MGPGLLESAYEDCLSLELESRAIAFERQKPLPVTYKNQIIDCAYRIDVMVNDAIVIELKSVHRIQPIHKAQLLTYLKLSGKKLGLLINFNVPVLMDRILRIVN